MKNQKGFSLIELLIVVLIIGIISAIAIPNLIAARRSANEGSAAASLRAIHSAEFVYSSTKGNTSYTNDLSVLQDAGIIDALLGSGSKSGYNYALAVDSSGNSSFTVGAVPQVTSGPMKTGSRKFCVAAHGIIHTDNIQADLGTNITNDGDCSEANYNSVL